MLADRTPSISTPQMLLYMSLAPDRLVSNTIIKSYVSVSKQHIETQIASNGLKLVENPQK